MKRFKLTRSLVGIAVASGLLVGAAHADVLIQIDLSETNEVTLTAMPGLSVATITGPDNDGIYFENFYGVAGNALNESLISGNLTNAQNPSDGTPLLYRDSSSDTGLNFWSWSSDTDVSFTAGGLAFTGSATFSLNATEYQDMLNGNTSGNIYFPAYNSSQVAGATLLGTYEVIPEPSTVALAGLSSVGLLLSRRLMKRKTAKGMMAMSRFMVIYEQDEEEEIDRF